MPLWALGVPAHGEPVAQASTLAVPGHGEAVAVYGESGQSLSLSKGLPEYMLEQLRTIAHKRDVPYQSLIKIFLKERIDQELHSIT